MDFDKFLSLPPSLVLFAAGLVLQLTMMHARHVQMSADALGVGPLIHPPRAPLGGRRLRVGYCSSDIGNHPLSHLMGSVWGMHDRERLEVRAGLRRGELEAGLVSRSASPRACRTLQAIVVVAGEQSAAPPDVVTVDCAYCTTLFFRRR